MISYRTIILNIYIKLNKTNINFKGGAQMFLVDWIKAEAYFFNHNEILQYSRLIKYDDKISKKNGGGLYWGTNFMALAIKNCMIEQNDDPEDMAEKLSLWLSIRLRYTNDEVIKLMKDFYNNEYHYDYVLYGMRIFDVMKNNCLSYPEAILLAYEMGTNFKETKMLSRYFKGPGHGLKMKYAYDFTEVGKIKYDFNRYHRLVPNLTVEQHEELMEIVRTSSIKIAKEMGIITSDDEFDGLNLDEYKELKARLVKNEKQILIDKGLWSDNFGHEYWTDEERAAKEQENLEAGRRILAERGIIL